MRPSIFISSEGLFKARLKVKTISIDEYAFMYGKDSSTDVNEFYKPIL